MVDFLKMPRAPGTAKLYDFEKLSCSPEPIEDLRLF
jgi:hypothetical protein